MVLNLNPSPEIEQYLTQKAEEQGISPEAFTLQLLSEYIAKREKQDKLFSLLQSWLAETDSEEQQDTGEYLIDALDQDRLSDHQLFPQAMKGITW